MGCLSAMQKCIRRGMEREAMEFAVELLMTSRNFYTMVTNRLEVISHEDIDVLSAPWIIPFVATACAQARAWYDPKKPGRGRMAIGNSIRLMADAPKSRIGDHFQIAIGLRAMLQDYKPAIPDWADDQHTMRGKRLGRGLDYFRSESTRLHPAPTRDDPYEDEAYRMLELRDGKRDAPEDDE